MSKKISIFLVSGLAIIFGFSSVQAVTFSNLPTLQAGLTIASGTSITLTGTPNRVLNWSTYDGNAATATYATSAGTATNATSASTANALASNPANCSAGYYPLGIAANGSVESCTLAATGGISGSGTANYLSKWTGASAQGDSVVYDNGTNVGIGTNAPAAKLDVRGNVDVNGGNIYFSDTAGQTRTSLRSYSNASSLWMIQPSTQILVLADAVDWDRSMSLQYTAGTTGAAAGVLTIGQTGKNSTNWTHGVTRFYTNGSERLNINSAGTVTIPGAEVLAGGSSSNWASLNVGGAQSIQTAGSIYSYNSMCVGNSSGACSSTGGVVLGLTNSSANVNIPSSANVIFNNGYNVGIGTTNPSAKLYVDGGTGYTITARHTGQGWAIMGDCSNANGCSGVTGSSSGSNINNVGVSGIGGGVGVQAVSSDGYGLFAQSTNGYAVFAHSLNSYSGYFEGKGIFTGNLEAAAFLYTSDRNLKKNIKTLDNPLSKIMQLRGVSFNWKKDDAASIGLIAQEVEKVYPELVSTNEDGLKAVQYGNLVAPLIEAVKAQQKTIDQLETRISILEMKK